jgi:hypothetical protein
MNPGLELPGEDRASDEEVSRLVQHAVVVTVGYRYRDAVSSASRSLTASSTTSRTAATASGPAAALMQDSTNRSVSNRCIDTDWLVPLKGATKSLRRGTAQGRFADRPERLSRGQFGVAASLSRYQSMSRFVLDSIGIT